MKRWLAWIAALLVVGTVSAAPARSPQPIVAVRSAASASPPPPHDDPKPAETVLPRAVFASRADVRAIAVAGAHLWLATGGGLERHDVARLGDAPRVFGTLEGLDTLDVRSVRIEAGVVVAETATGRCSRSANARFACEARAPRPPALPSKEALAGHAVSARVELSDGAVVGTRGGGAYFVPRGSGAPRRLGADVDGMPASFVHKAVRFGDALVFATFRDGLARLPVDHASGEPVAPVTLTKVSTPFAMVNDVAVLGGVLYVAANEGFFSSPDGVRFDLVPAIGARSITGVAPGPNGTLWVTSTGALYAVPAGGRGRVLAAHLAPAGSRSVQSVVSDGARGAWLATEDRGAVHFDGARFTAWDRLAGLPSSWVVAVASDGSGGVYASTLRNGFMHIARDGTYAPVAGAPGDWALTASRRGGVLAMGSQEGAHLVDAAGRVRALGALPDRRVHLFVQSGRTLLVGTESGLGLYDVTESS